MHIYLPQFSNLFFKNGIGTHNLGDIQHGIYQNKTTTYMENICTKRVRFLFVDDFNAVNLKQRKNL